MGESKETKPKLELKETKPKPQRVAVSPSIITGGIWRLPSVQKSFSRPLQRCATIQEENEKEH